LIPNGQWYHHLARRIGQVVKTFFAGNSAIVQASTHRLIEFHRRVASTANEATR
jgi:hypothetical protein